MELPHSIQAALDIDKRTGTNFWWKDIHHELGKIMVAFDIDENASADGIRLGHARGDYVRYQEI